MGISAGLAWFQDRDAATRAAVVLLLGVVAGVAAALAVANPTVSMTIALLIVAPLPIIVRLVQRRFDPFEPIQILSLTFCILYAVRPVAELGFGIEFFVDKPLRAGYVGGAGIALVGMLAIYGGYALGAGRKLAARIRPLPTMWDPNRAVVFALWLLAFSALLTALFAASVGPGTLLNFYLGRTRTDFATFLTVTGYVALGPYLTIPASFILLFAYSRLRTWKVGLLLVATLLAALYVTVPRGDRTYILILVLPLLVLWFLRRGTRPKLLGTAVAVFAAILAMNVLLAIRHVDKRAQAGGVVGRVSTALTHPTSELETFVTGVDLAEFSVLELEWQAYQEEASGVEYHPGSTLLALAVYPIPRSLIGTKPPSGGQTVTKQLFPAKGASGPKSKRASFNGGMFGEQFADFGWVTLLIYSMILGIGVRVLWEYFKLYASSEGLQIVFAASLPMLIVLVRNGAIDTLARSLFQVGPLVLCLLICSRPAMRRLAGYRARPTQGGVAEAVPDS